MIDTEAIRIWGGPALFVLLALTPLHGWAESSMIAHMLLQIPLLVPSGAWLAYLLSARFRNLFGTFNAGEIPGLLSALETIGFWLLPRSLDGALNEGAMELAKLASLPLLAGVPLTLSLPRLKPVAKGFVLVNLISMLAVMGWLYLSAPSRLCNNYLLNEQILLGKLLLSIAIFLVAGFAWRIFFGKSLHDNELANDAAGKALGPPDFAP